MAIYDPEQFIRDLEIVFKANLNAEIAIIDVEKGDFVLDPINASAWYMNQLPRVFSYPRFVVWGIVDNSIEDNADVTTLNKIDVIFEVVIPDKGDKVSEAAIFQLLRYSRALSSIANKNSGKFQGIAKLKVDSLLPAPSVVGGKKMLSAGISVSGIFSAN